MGHLRQPQNGTHFLSEKWPYLCLWPAINHLIDSPLDFMTIYVRGKIWSSLYRSVTQVLLALGGKGNSPKQTSLLWPSKHPIHSSHNCLNFVPRLANRNGLISRPQKWPCWKYMKMWFLQGTQEIGGFYKQLVRIKKVLDRLAEMFAHKCLGVFLFKCCIFSPFRTFICHHLFHSVYTVIFPDELQMKHDDAQHFTVPSYQYSSNPSVTLFRDTMSFPPWKSLDGIWWFENN